MQRLSDAWESEAGAWASWARSHDDSYWQFHRHEFLALIPPPGSLTVEVGCGEGRVGRDLAERGHRVVALDRAPTMARLTAAVSPTRSVLVADASHLPFPRGVADLVVAFMALHNMDTMQIAIEEIGRVVRSGGHFCFAIVHPLNSAGTFIAEARDAEFVIPRSYFAPRRHMLELERRDLRMSFHSMHHSLGEYFAALQASGFVVECLREPRPGDGGHGDRVPLFLDMRARKD